MQAMRHICITILSKDSLKAKPEKDRFRYVQNLQSLNAKSGLTKV